MFEVQEALTSATGTPSGGRQCNTIMPFRGTSVPWGSCSKFFLRSRGENKQPTLKNSMKKHLKIHTESISVSCVTFSPDTYIHGHDDIIPSTKSCHQFEEEQPFQGTTRSVCYQSDMDLLTGDPHSCLAALGGSQVAPGDAQTPVILWAVKVLHLLT